MILASLLLLLPGALAETIAEIQGECSLQAITTKADPCFPGTKFQSPFAGQSVRDVTGLVTVCHFSFGH